VEIQDPETCASWGILYVFFEHLSPHTSLLAEQKTNQAWLICPQITSEPKHRQWPTADKLEVQIEIMDPKDSGSFC